jgi:hypothetical protein
LAAVAIALALATRADAAGWTSTKTIAAPVDGLQDEPAVVVGPRGQLAVTWSQTEGIGVAFARRGWSFGRPDVVPRSSGDYGPALGIDAAGNTTIASTHDFECSLDGISTDVCGRIHAWARLRDGAFTRRRTLSSKRFDNFYPRVSVSARGRAAVWWDGFNFDGGEHDGAGARVARRPGRFGRTEMRKRDIAAWTFDRRGRSAQVVFQNRHGLVAFTRRAGGKLRHRRTLLKVRGPKLYAFEISTDSQGLVSAAWETVREGRFPQPDTASLVVGLRTFHGRLGAQTLARDRQSGVTPVALATGPTGFSVAAWGIRGTKRSTFSFDDDYAHEAQIRGAVSFPNRTFGRSQRLLPRYPERPVYGVEAAAGPRSAVVAWRATRPDGAQGIYASRVGPRGRFGRRRLLSADSSAGMSDPAVVVDSHDNATVVWIDGLRIRAARFSSG